MLLSFLPKDYLFSELEEAETLLDEINFEIKEGEKIGILSNKDFSSLALANIMSKIVTPTRGDVNLNTATTLINKPSSLFRPMITLRENMLFALGMLNVDRKNAVKIVEEIDSLLHIGQELDRMLYDVSSANIRDAAFYCILNTTNPLMIIHHQYVSSGTSLEVPSYQYLKQKIKDKSLIAFSGDIDILKELCDKVYFLHEGKLVSPDKAKSFIPDDSDDLESEIDLYDDDEDDMDIDVNNFTTKRPKRSKPPKDKEIGSVNSVRDFDGNDLYYQKISKLVNPNDVINYNIDITFLKSIRIKSLDIKLTSNVKYYPLYSKKISNDVASLIPKLKVDAPTKLSINFSMTIPNLPPGGYGIVLSLICHEFDEEFRFKIANIGISGNSKIEDRLYALLPTRSLEITRQEI